MDKSGSIIQFDSPQYGQCLALCGMGLRQFQQEALVLISLALILAIISSISDFLDSFPLDLIRSEVISDAFIYL